MKMKIITLLLVVASACFAQINTDFNNRFMLGENYERAGDLEKAKSIFEDLYKHQPDNYPFFDALNRVYIQLKEYENAIKLIENRLKITPEDINLFGLLGKVYYLKGDENKSFHVWDEALSKLPPNSMNYRIIANYAIERRAFEKAVELLKKGREISDDQVYFSYDLANIYSLTMQYKEAASEYCFILSQQPNQLRAVESRILSYINKPDALPKTILVIEEWADKGELNFIYLLARLNVEAKEFNKAYELYLLIDDKQNNQGVELYNFAQLLFSEEEYETAAKAFSEVLSRYPNSPIASTAKLGYAKTMEAKHEKEIATSQPVWKPFYLISKNNSPGIEEVISAYIELSKAYPHTEIAYESLYRIGKIKLNKQDDLTGSKEYFQKIIDEFPLSSFAPHSNEALGEIELRNGDLSKSKEYYNKIISNGRADDEQKNNAKYMLAIISFFKDDFSKAKGHLSEILNNLKDNAANDAIEFSLLLNTNMNDSTNLTIFAQAEYLADQKKFNEASEKYKVFSNNPKAFMLQNLAKLREAEMELALDNLDKSISLLESISDENEKNIYADKALFLLGKIYRFGRNNPPKAIEVFEKLLAKFPNSLYLDEARNQIIFLRNKLS